MPINVDKIDESALLAQYITNFEEQPTLCPICHTEIDLKYTENSFTDDRTELMVEYHCDECGSSWISNYQLESTRIRKAIPQKPKASLSDNALSVVVNANGFTCPICYNENIDVIEEHGDTQIIECQLCGTRWSVKSEIVSVEIISSVKTIGG